MSGRVKVQKDQPAWSAAYAPSWVDRLQTWLETRRLPLWSIYLLAWLAVWALVSGPVVLSGTALPTSALRVHASFSANAVLFLAAMHHLDLVAARAIRTFRPAMKAHRRSSRELACSMTTMPARPVLLITVLGAALPLLLSPVMVTAMRQFYLATSPAAIVVNIGLVSSIESATFLVFLFHTVRQLRVVSRVHNHYSHVSMFRLQSLYGLSSLTARTALVFVLIGAVAYATRGSEPTSPVGSQLWVDPVAVGLGYLVLSVTTAGAVFAFPLIGLHRMLVKEKEGLQVETDRRLERAMEDLHRLLDASELERIDGLSKAISTLVTEREVIRRMPTWPWSPGALKVLVSAVVTPIVVWLLQYALERTVLP